MAEAEYKSELNLTKQTPYFAHLGELLGVSL